MGDPFIYLSEWQVLLCTSCGYCLRPGRDVWVRHLRQHPHCLKGASLKALVELFSSYDLRAAEAEPARLPAKAIPGLRLLDGFQCLTCSAHLTRDCKSMQRHVSKAHQQKPALHEKSPLWRGCKLQTFFAENRWVRYFVVEEGEAAARGSSECSFTGGLDSREADFFTQLDEDAAIADEDAKAEANTVHGFGSHRSAVVPWLRRTGIEEHTRGLKKDEMHTSFAVPKNAESEPELFLMLEVMDEIFTEAHSWCFDGPDCMLTWPRQLALSRFHTAAGPGQKIARVRPEEGAQYAQDQLRLLEAVLDLLLPGGLPRQPLYHGRRRPADPGELHPAHRWPGECVGSGLPKRCKARPACAEKRHVGPLNGADLPRIWRQSVQLPTAQLLRYAQRQAVHQDVEGAGQL
jgi:hypothetical protein